MVEVPNSTVISIEQSSFLITGGSGSFGSTMVRKLLESGVGFIRVLSRDESKHHALQNELQDSRVEYQIGDIREPESIRYALRDIDYVFHAAALKHVPASEVNPFEYTKTNVFGSHNLLTELSKSKVISAVFLSTDKAVYPVNAMGMSKALMEKLVRSSSYLGGAKSCITRYGNVIGSRGSVIPVFIDSIKRSKPIHITDWGMTRFIMSLEDSVKLVLFALENGKQGDLFVQKAPAANLKTILEALELLLGKKAPEIHITGIRPGEKIHETLLNAEERTYAEETDNFFRVPSVVLERKKDNPKGYSLEEFKSDSTRLLSSHDLLEFLRNDKEISRLI
jgi:UDP-glucose 4-epimerase